MYALIIVDWNGRRVRSSFRHKLAEAEAYANDVPGIVAIQKVGVGIVRQLACPHCNQRSCPGKNGSPNYANEDFDVCQHFNSTRTES